MKKALDGIERSPYNGMDIYYWSQVINRDPNPDETAFKLKPRKFESYEISSSGVDDPTISAGEEVMSCPLFAYVIINSPNLVYFSNPSIPRR
jgi:hypothetical protein